jgi:2-polyprenyl-3-methyl-5-hydroxy-6-metoxy-1,4-benzoquinol methylase
MRIAAGEKENGIIIGNHFDKYQSANAVIKLMMKGFQSALDDLVAIASPHSIHEVGCGEGHLTIRWLENGFQVKGSDFSEKVIQIAKDNATRSKQSPDVFNVKSIYDITPSHDEADLIVCCEVLEHLLYPKLALTALQGIVYKHLIVSVPREPLWRILNVARGKYLYTLGNTPGHLQHWSSASFCKLIENKEVRNPLPWTMILCTPKHN